MINQGVMRLIVLCILIASWFALIVMQLTPVEPFVDLIKMSLPSLGLYHVLNPIKPITGKIQNEPGP